MNENDILRQQEKYDEQTRDIAASDGKLRKLVDRALAYFDRYRPRIGRRLGHSLTTVLRLAHSYLHGNYRDVSKTTLSLLVFGLLYFVSPLDMIPDFLGPVGFLDDAFVLGWVVQRIAGELRRFRTWERARECRGRLPLPQRERIDKVVLVAGWLSEKGLYKEHTELLGLLYPRADVEVFRWHANALWGDAVRLADGEAPKEFAKRLLAFSDGELEKTVVVGHSLGGRITVRALAWLSADERFVSGKARLAHALLMGAAIDNDDEDIAAIGATADGPVLDFHSLADGVLRYLYQPFQGKVPLGLDGLGERFTAEDGNVKSCANIYDIKVSGNEEHLLGFVENAATLASMFKSKAPLKVLTSSPDILGKVGDMNLHQFLYYLKFYKILLEEDRGSALSVF